jgi:hypothetical protein
VTVSIRSAPSIWARAVADLDGRAEQVGFFLANFDATTQRFTLTDWRVVPPEGVEFEDPFHVTLRDETQGEMIRWAWQSNACLVEAHSHDRRWAAAFSPSDLAGFVDWVPHVRWRLRGRPYAALLSAGETFDALAWVDGSDGPEAVGEITLGDGSAVQFTGETWRRLMDAEGGDSV